MKKHAISDIHGCKKTFLALLDKIAFSKADSLYLLGDYIDRGPDSKGVLDQILSLEAQGYRIYCLRGNHDQMLLDALESDENLRFWQKNGGRAALQSFGCEHPAEIPAIYLDFVASLGCVLESDPYILVHAGLNFKADDPLQDQTAMLWIRKWYPDINYSWLGARTILHGHTPLSGFEFEQQYQQLAINQFLDIDCGCVYIENAHLGMGRLCAFNMTDQSVVFQPNIDVTLL